MKEPDFQPIDVEAFYLRYGPMVLRRCRKMLMDEQSACDAMQDVFLNVLKSRDHLTGEHPSSLLYRMATNTCLNRIRERNAHETKPFLDILQQVPAYGIQDRETFARNLLDYVLANENEPARKIAVMYFLDGMTLKEIAATLKLSVSGAHKHLEKLRRRIRETGEAS